MRAHRSALYRALEGANDATQESVHVAHPDNATTAAAGFSSKKRLQQLPSTLEWHKLIEEHSSSQHVTSNRFNQTALFCRALLVASCTMQPELVQEAQAEVGTHRQVRDLPCWVPHMSCLLHRISLCE